MNEDRHGFFKELDPPPGGAERFRARLDAAAESRRGPAWRLAVAVAAGVVVVVGALVVLNDADRNSSDSRRPSSVGCSVGPSSVSIRPSR
jgi:hypothetical protein